MPLGRAAILVRCGLLMALLVGGGLLLAKLHHLLLGMNDHVVLPGQVYRCSQPQCETLTELSQRHGLRTVINLRGRCQQFDWYRNECLATAELDLDQVDICWSAIRLPPPDELRRLIQALDRATRPVLLHCRQGVDRTGLASTIALLLTEGVHPSVARQQLGPWYGHVPINGTEQMEAFVDQYTAWLASVACEHSPGVFRHWAERVYSPGECRATLTPLDWPEAVPAGQAQRLTFRSQNTSNQAWVFKPGRTSGTHARWIVMGMDGPYLRHGETGLYHHTVEPGEAVELDLPLPPLPAGNYLLMVDMIDRRQTAFAQEGSKPLMRGLRVE